MFFHQNGNSIIINIFVLSTLFLTLFIPLDTSASMNLQNHSMIQTGREAMYEGDYETAITYFDMAIGNNEDLLTAYNNKGVALMRLGRCNESLEIFSRGEKIAPRDQNLLLNIALAQNCVGDRNQAENTIQKGLDIYPNQTEFLLLKSTFDREDRNYVEALQNIEIVLNNDPKNHEAWYEKSITYTLMQDYLSAYTAIQQAVVLNPNDTIYMYNKAVIEEKIGKNSDALISYNSVLNIEPSNVHALYNKASIYWNHYRLNESLDEFDKVVKLEPDIADAWFFRGLVLKELQRYEEASASFSNATAINPNNNLYNAYAERYQNLDINTTKKQIPLIPVSILIVFSILVSIGIMIYSYQKVK